MAAAAASLSSTSTTLFTFSPKPSSSQKSPLFSLPPPLLLTLNFPNKNTTIASINNLFSLSYPISCFSNATPTPPNLSSTTTTKVSSSNSTHWIVVVKPPPNPSISKPQLINYYVQTLERVLGSEENAQMCIYNASSDTHFGFCCDIDEETSRELASLPEVLSVRPDLDFNSLKKDYSYSNDQFHLSTLYNGGSPLFPAGNSKHWLVRVETPAVGVITKAQVVDFYAQILTNVLGNEKDAQMCIYHISWQSDYGFCCELDDECANELADVPGVLSVQPDQNVESDSKDYRGERDSSATDQPTNIKTKKLFVTGLSFYTSEKTLRAAFEGFGELVEVKIIMDKISKRSRGFAFIEYTTEEAASAALKEMNGKIINGWMIVVVAAKPNPLKYSRGRPRHSI